MAAPARGISITTSFYTPHNNFDVCVINGSMYALFSKNIQSNENISIDLKDYNIILLAPIEAEGNIFIRAINIIVLTTLWSKTGETDILASGKFISLGGEVRSHLDNNVKGNLDVCLYGIIKERKEMIVEQFKQGILQQHGPMIVNALVETFDAIEDPSGDNNDRVEVAKAFRFFNLPFRV